MINEQFYVKKLFDVCRKA